MRQAFQVEDASFRMLTVPDREMEVRRLGVRSRNWRYNDLLEGCSQRQSKRVKIDPCREGARGPEIDCVANAREMKRFLRVTIDTSTEREAERRSWQMRPTTKRAARSFTCNLQVARIDRNSRDCGRIGPCHWRWHLMN
jgi:hypothetical protein